jgi:hypothetical protein
MQHCIDGAQQMVATICKQDLPIRSHSGRHDLCLHANFELKIMVERAHLSNHLAFATIANILS